jgi:hypothetical protein
MKLIKFLNEKIELDTINDIGKLIRKDCKKYINEVVKSNIVLYRGMFDSTPSRGKSIHDGFFRIKTRKNREPADTPIEIHNYINNQFKKNFGWNVRSEGVFVVKNKRISWNYGTAFIFFPIGDYKYIYSNKIYDLYTHIEDGPDFYMYALKDDKEKAISDYLRQSFKNQYEKEYGEFTKNGEYIFRDKPTGEYEYYKATLVIKRKYPDITKAEIDEELVWEPEISFDIFLDEKLERFKKIFYYDIDKIMKTYKTSNIKSADDDTEIIFKCKEYYVLHEMYDHKLIYDLLQD